MVWYWLSVWCDIRKYLAVLELVFVRDWTVPTSCEASWCNIASQSATHLGKYPHI